MERFCGGSVLDTSGALGNNVYSHSCVLSIFIVLGVGGRGVCLSGAPKPYTLNPVVLLEIGQATRRDAGRLPGCILVGPVKLLA